MSSDRFQFDERITSVKINDTGDRSFICDEEPHMLPWRKGYGYYNLALGQKLEDSENRELEIVRKLGWGANSSVWLARVFGKGYPTKYLSVKVLTTHATVRIMSGLGIEDQALLGITQGDTSHPGYRHSLHLYDWFVAESSHGPHFCYVTNVLGDHLDALRRNLKLTERNTLPGCLTKRITKQILLALDYLHRECKMIHTDVKPGNILVSLEGADSAIDLLMQEFPSAYYEPRLEPALSPDPIITVKSQPLPNFGLQPDGSNLSICLADYGSALHIGKIPSEGAQPVLLRAPEIILGHPNWSTPVDIWSLGCLVFEFLTGAAFFDIYQSAVVKFEDVHLRRILERIGPFPLSFLQECKRRDEFFDLDGSLLRIDEFEELAIEDDLRTYAQGIGIDGTEIPAAATFIRKCLTVNPSERPSALQLQEDEWLKDA